ncbi:MAG: dolichyl-phosphate beta-glucosyltransferase [bacterium]
MNGTAPQANTHLLRSRSLSVVIPAFNEERRIGATLDRVVEYLAASAADFEVIVVDDGSSDRTTAVVRDRASRDARVRLVALGENHGKGEAVKRGVLAARGEWVIFSDADLSTPIEEAEKLLAKALDGFPVTIGSRTIRGANVEVHQPWYRELMGKTFNAFVRVVVLDGFVDTQCGFKCFRGDAARAIFERTRIKRFAFDVEALIVARRLGLAVAEVPIRWANEPHSRVAIFRDSTRMFLDLFRIRWFAMTGRYGRGAARNARGAER